MKKTNLMRAAAGAAAIAGLGYAALAGRAWLRFGRAARPGTFEERDPLLDIFVPHYDVVERHHIAVDAPAALTLPARVTSTPLAPACRARSSKPASWPSVPSRYRCPPAGWWP